MVSLCLNPPGPKVMRVDSIHWLSLGRPIFQSWKAGPGTVNFLKEAEQSRIDPPLLKYRQRTILPQNRATHSKRQSQSMLSRPGRGYTSRLSLLLPKFSLYLLIILMSLNKSKRDIFSALRPLFPQLSSGHLSVPQHTQSPMHPCGLYTKSLHRQHHLAVFTAALELDGLVEITTLLHFTYGRNNNNKQTSKQKA